MATGAAYESAIRSLFFILITMHERAHLFKSFMFVKMLKSRQEVRYLLRFPHCGLSPAVETLKNP